MLASLDDLPVAGPGSGPGAQEGSAPRAVVLAWPDYSAANPYQTLLYGGNAYGVAYRYAPVETALDLVRSGSVAVPVIFHLHWVSRLFEGVRNPVVAFRLASAFVARLHAFRALGGRVVWTIHNAVSHEALDPDRPGAVQDEELWLCGQIARIADVIHVHDAGSLDEITGFDVPRDRVVVVPHGHYAGVYPDTIGRAEARRRLGYTDADEVCLFFGMFRKYKGVEELIEAFRDLLAERATLKLLLVGRGSDDPLGPVRPRLSDRERQAIRVEAGFIPDDRVQEFFRAADIAVFPYRRILTSGSVMLSLGFGVPTVAADVAMTRSVLAGGDLGRTIPAPGRPDQIAAAMRDLLASGTMGQIGAADQAAFRERYRWRDFSVEVVKPLVERGT